MTLEQIYKALETIQDTCNDQSSCERCPFGTREDGACLIRATIPSRWKLNNLSELKLMEEVTEVDYD